MSAVPVASDATGKGASAGFLDQTEFGQELPIATDGFRVVCVNMTPADLKRPILVQPNWPTNLQIRCGF
jgi:hypothetical protein